MKMTKLLSLSLLVLATLFNGCSGKGNKNNNSADTQTNSTNSIETNVDNKKFMADERNGNNTEITIVLPENGAKIVPHLTEKTKIIDVKDVYYLITTDFSDGVCFVRNNDRDKKWAIMDTHGDFLTDFVFSFIVFDEYKDELPYFYNGVCMLYGAGNGYNDGMILINKKGEVIKHLPNVFDRSQFVNGVATGFVRVADVYMSEGLQKRTSIKNVYINTSGEFVFTNLSAERISEYSQLKPAYGYHNGLAKFYDYHAKRWGYIDRAGNIMISAVYKEAQDFSDGLAAVMNENDSWGYIDTKGNTKIDFVYSNEPTHFSEGFATVRKRKNDLPYCFIDTSGTIRLEELNQGGTFFNGKAIVNGNLHWQLIDSNMKILRDFQYTSSDIRVPSFRANGVLYSRNGPESFSVVTESGEIIIDELRGTFHDGLARHWGKKSFINPKGEIVILFREPEF
jgi:hypothetical protein